MKKLPVEVAVAAVVGGSGPAAAVGEQAQAGATDGSLDWVTGPVTSLSVTTSTTCSLVLLNSRRSTDL
jgi:hypothetical protein